MTVANRSPSTDPKKLLTKEFAAVGLKKDVFQALPEWWEEALAHPSYLMKAAALADAATRFGREHHIDPGHVVLNAVRNTKVNGKSPWGLGASALKHLDHEAASSVVCREALRRNIDVDALSDDSFDFLERLGVL